jgi:predicted nucleic acid-binding protein
MRTYLDLCSIQRPLDTKSHLRIIMEAEAILGVLAQAEAGRLSLVASDAHAFEIGRNPHPVRKRYAQEAVAKAAEYVQADEAIAQRAREYDRAGIKALDALHLACAVISGVDFFCTCDDRFYRRAKQLDTGTTTVVTPLELIQEIEP